MQKTVHAILTDASARQEMQVEVRLSEEFSAGRPWYGKQ